MSQLQQSLETSKQKYDKQFQFLNRLQKLVAYQKSEIDKLRAIEDEHCSIVQKTESLEAQLNVSNIMTDGCCYCCNLSVASHILNLLFQLHSFFIYDCLHML